MTLSVVSSGNYGDSAGSLADSHTCTGGANVGILIFTQSRNGTDALTAGEVTVGGVAAVEQGTVLNHQTGRYMGRWWISPANHPGAGAQAVAAGPQASADRVGACVIEIGGSTGTPSVASAPTGVIGSGATGDLAVTAGGSDLVVSACQRGAAIANSYTPDSGQTELFDAAAVSGLGWAVGHTTGGSQADWTATAGGGNIGIVGVVITEASGSSPYGVSDETDSAVALVGTDNATYGVATETGAAVALVGSESVAYGVATETDEAVALVDDSGTFYGIATETDLAVALVGSDVASYGVATETGSAVALVGSALASYGVSTETDTAVALAGSVAASYGVATETDSAVALTVDALTIAFVSGSFSTVAPGVSCSFSTMLPGVSASFAD